MKIAIMGAGLTGAYLYRLLDKRRHKIDVFDESSGTRCGLKPCAWGTSRGFSELVRDSGLDPEKYIQRRFDHVIMDGLEIPSDLMTFDKPRFVKDLLKGVKINFPPPDVASPNIASYDRIIDATGVSRAFLPAPEDDIIMPCVQYRIRSDAILKNRIHLGGIGFAWCFPLSNKEYHIGCGSLLSDPHKRLKELGWIGENIRKIKVLCACHGKVRLTGPQFALPFVRGDAPDGVWGVGEAIGCTAPLAGDGIVPGMKSVRLLLERWDDPTGYTRAIQKEFAWMKRERIVVDKLRMNEALGLKDAWVLRKNSRRMGMQVRLKDAGTLLRHLRSQA